MTKFWEDYFPHKQLCKNTMVSHTFLLIFFRFGLRSHPRFLWNHSIYRLVFCIFGFCICFVIWTFHLVMYMKQAAPHFSWDLPRYFIQMYVRTMCWGFGSPRPRTYTKISMKNRKICVRNRFTVCLQQQNCDSVEQKNSKRWTNQWGYFFHTQISYKDCVTHIYMHTRTHTRMSFHIFASSAHWCHNEQSNGSTIL